jgi:hypothetical protein
MGTIIMYLFLGGGIAVVAAMFASDMAERSYFDDTKGRKFKPDQSKERGRSKSARRLPKRKEESFDQSTVESLDESEYEKMEDEPKRPKSKRTTSRSRSKSKQPQKIVESFDDNSTLETEAFDEMNNIPQQARPASKPVRASSRMRMMQGGQGMQGFNQGSNYQLHDGNPMNMNMNMNMDMNNIHNNPHGMRNGPRIDRDFRDPSQFRGRSSSRNGMNGQGPMPHYNQNGGVPDPPDFREQQFHSRMNMPPGHHQQFQSSYRGGGRGQQQHYGMDAPNY